MSNPQQKIVFLFDVDNTLLDNDRVGADLSRHLERHFGTRVRERYFALFEELRRELGYADYLGALQRYRVENPRDPRLLTMSSFLVDYPFANRLYPNSLDAIGHCRQWGACVVLSDGDVVFQPRKVERSGILEAVERNVLIYIHKDAMLDDVEAHYPADHYVMFDDKVRILTAMKKYWGNKLTTVFPRQGHYAMDVEQVASFPPPDITVERIGDVLNYDLPTLLGAANGKPAIPAKRGARFNMINPNTKALHDVGQSLWLDNITRGLLTSGTLKKYIDELSVTGLTSNPTIFDNAIKKTKFYDDVLKKRSDGATNPESVFFELAIEDLTAAAGLFSPVHQATKGQDGWVSLEVSPLLAYDAKATQAMAVKLFKQAQRANLYIKIPGTPEGLGAIEESIFAGVPINVTLLFSREQYLAAAEAYTRGIERRLAAGLPLKVESVASLFISRWDKSVADKVPENLKNKLGIAIGMRAYKAYREFITSPRWQKLIAAGARPQRLLWASTGTKDPKAPDTMYLTAFAAPDTVNTIPEETLKAYADHGQVKGILPVDGGNAEQVLADFVKAGVDINALALQLQKEAAVAFVESWEDLMSCIKEKSSALQTA